MYGHVNNVLLLDPRPYGANKTYLKWCCICNCCLISPLDWMVTTSIIIFQISM